MTRRYAHDESQLQCVRILLEAGADVNALTREGMTAADICSAEGILRDLLWQHGALRAREFPLSLNGDEDDLTAVLKAANPEMKDMDAQGLHVFRSVGLLLNQLFPLTPIGLRSGSFDTPPTDTPMAYFPFPPTANLHRQHRWGNTPYRLAKKGVHGT